MIIPKNITNTRTCAKRITPALLSLSLSLSLSANTVPNGDLPNKKHTIFFKKTVISTRKFNPKIRRQKLVLIHEQKIFNCKTTFFTKYKKIFLFFFDTIFKKEQMTFSYENVSYSSPNFKFCERQRYFPIIGKFNPKYHTLISTSTPLGNSSFISASMVLGVEL